MTNYNYDAEKERMYNVEDVYYKSYNHSSAKERAERTKRINQRLKFIKQGLIRETEVDKEENTRRSINGILFVVVLVLFIILIKTCGSDTTGKDYTRQNPGNTTEIQNSHWVYSAQNNQGVYEATNYSIDSIWQNGHRLPSLVLNVRSGMFDSLIGINRGITINLLNGRFSFEGEKRIYVKFNNEDPTLFDYDNMGYSDKEDKGRSIFIVDYNRFLDKMKNSDSVIIQYKLYGTWDRIASFNISNFQWEH